MAARDGRPNKFTERTAGFILVVTWLGFFALPLAASQGLRSGIFVPSPAWDAQVPWAIAQGMVVGLLLLVAAFVITILCLAGVANKSPLQHRLGPWVILYSFLTCLLALPFWGWGFEQGMLRVWAHERARTLEPVATEAVVSSYYVNERRRSRDVPVLNLRVAPYGRLKVQRHPAFKPGFEPQKGMSLRLTGRRTWVGVYYDTVEWPLAWLAEK
jgi:hypothetical protein